jgi:hypothetical protein
MTTYKPKRNVSDEELYAKLFNTLFAIIVLVIALLLTFRFFGPKIGSFFGLISVNRKAENRTDKLVPLPPVFLDTPKSTNKDTISLTGSAEPGTNITLFVNGPKRETVLADQSGEFNFANITISRGKNTIFAVAEDKSGNTSEKSDTILIVFDNTKPKIKILEPLSGQTITNLQNRIKVKGSVNEKVEVKVNDRIAITRPDNTFELLLGVKEGDVAIKIVAVDEAGNKAEQSVNVKYQND